MIGGKKANDHGSRTSFSNLRCPPCTVGPFTSKGLRKEKEHPTTQWA